MKRKLTEIKIVPHKGRGVFAAENIGKGEHIETCHMIVLDNKEVGKTLERFVFYFSKTKLAMPLGNGPLYNHSDKPNAWVEMDDANLTMEIKSLRRIKKGEEILIDYGYTPAERKKFGIR